MTWPWQHGMVLLYLVLLLAGGLAVFARGGDLHVNQEDSGPGASMTGADEAEYIAAIVKENKDRLLLALLEAHYGGNTNVLPRLLLEVTLSPVGRVNPRNLGHTPQGDFRCHDLPTV